MVNLDSVSELRFPSHSSSGGFSNLTLRFVVDLSLDPRIAFWIWLILGISQQSWIIYSIVSIVRKGSKGKAGKNQKFLKKMLVETNQ